jgi:hypothetical protein
LWLHFLSRNDFTRSEDLWHQLTSIAADWENKNKARIHKGTPYYTNQTNDANRRFKLRRSHHYLHTHISHEGSNYAGRTKVLTHTDSANSNHSSRKTPGR